MKFIHDIRLQKRLNRRSKQLSLIVLFIGAVVLVGWEFNIDTLKRMFPGLVAMNPVTALSFILLSISFLLITKENKTRYSTLAGYFLSTLVLVAAASKLIDFVYDFQIKPDLLLFAGKIKSTVVYGRPNYMAPNTAVCLLLSSLTLLLIHVQTKKKLIPAQFIAILTGFLGLLSILGYIYRLNLFMSCRFSSRWHCTQPFAFFCWRLLFFSHNHQKG